MRLFVLRPGSAGNNSISCLDDSISCFENQFWTPKNEKHLEKEAFSPDVCKYNEIERLIACPWVCQSVIFRQVKLALQLKIVFFGLTIVPRRSHLNFKTGNRIIQTGNGIFQDLNKKTLLQNVPKFYQEDQNRKWNYLNKSTVPSW